MNEEQLFKNMFKGTYYEDSNIRKLNVSTSMQDINANISEKQKVSIIKTGEAIIELKGKVFKLIIRDGGVDSVLLREENKWENVGSYYVRRLLYPELDVRHQYPWLKNY